MRTSIINFFFALAVLAIPAVIFRPPGDTWLMVSDFPAYYGAAKLISHGHAADVYEIHRLQLEIRRAWRMPPERQVFVAEPPIFMPAFEPLANFTPNGAVLFSFITAIAATALSLVLLSEALVLSNRATLWLIALTASSGPFWESMHCGKPVPFMLLGLSFAIYLLSIYRRPLAGVATVVALMKWHEILPFLAFSSGAKKYGYLLAILCSAVLLGIASTAIFGVVGWVNYFHLLGDMSKNPINVGYQSMPTLRGQLCLMGVNWTMVNAAAAIAYAASLIFLGWFGRRFANLEHWWIPGITCSSLAAVTFGLHSHQYDVLLLTPALCILIKEAAAARNRGLLGVAGALVAIYALPVYVSIHYGYFGSIRLGIGALNPFFLALLATTIYAFVFFGRSWSLLKSPHSGVRRFEEFDIRDKIEGRMAQAGGR